MIWMIWMIWKGSSPTKSMCIGEQSLELLLDTSHVCFSSAGLCFGLCFCASGFWACFLVFSQLHDQKLPTLGNIMFAPNSLPGVRERDRKREKEREREETSTTFWSISGFALPSVSSKSCLVFVLCFYSHVPPHAISFPYKMTGFLPRVCSF